MPDITDDTIAALVAAREHGLTAGECAALVADVYAAPWSDTPVVVENHFRRRRWRTTTPRATKRTTPAELAARS